MRTFRLSAEVDDGEHHGGDHGNGVGLEQVGGHAGAVADVVADVVGDGGGVSRIVLGDAGLDLADKVAADVGALGEDAAAETGEDRDQRGAEAQRHQRIDHRAAGRRVAEPVGQNGEVDGDAEQREPGHQEAGDGAGPERHGQALGERAGGGLRGAHVGAHRDQHAGETGRAGQHRADQEADRHRQPQQPIDDGEHDRADRGNRGVLAGQIGRGPLLDGGGDLAHARRPRIGGHQGIDGVGAVNERQASAQNDRPHHRLHDIPLSWRRQAAKRLSPESSGLFCCQPAAARAWCRIRGPDHAKSAKSLQHRHTRCGNWGARRSGNGADGRRRLCQGGIGRPGMAAPSAGPVAGRPAGVVSLLRLRYRRPQAR